MRVPRRHFSFHRHLTHVLRRPGRRREHFTFHFFSFNVYLCLLIMCFFISSLFFFPVLSCIFYKKEDEKSNQKISRDERTSESKSARGRTFSFGWIKKKCFIQAHCFRRKSRSQTTNKKLFCSRERERGFEGEDDALG